MKYCLKWSVDGFGNTEEARLWVGKFVDWYNTEHKHSGIKYVTPKERHCGLDTKILNKQEGVYKKARKRSCLIKHNYNLGDNRLEKHRK